MRQCKSFEALDVWTPYRIALAVSIDSEGKPNIIPLAWFMTTSFEPPMVAISIGHSKGRFNRHSHDLILKSKEFVLSIPSKDMAEAVMYCGDHSGKDVSKFGNTGLTQASASKVKPPLIKEAIANFECKVTGVLETGDHTIFAGKILAAWISDEKNKPLLSIGKDSGYKVLLEKNGVRFGIVED